MARKFAITVFVLRAIGAIVTLLIAAGTGQVVFGPLGYLVVFLGVPLLAALGIRRRSTWGVWLGLLWFAPQSVNFIGGSSAFYFMAPISFCLTVQDPDTGEVTLLNLFAVLMMVVLSVVLVQFRGDREPAGEGTAESG